MSLFLVASNPQDELELKQLFFISQELKKRGLPFFILTSPGSKLSSQAKLNAHPVINFKLDGSSGWLTTWKLTRLLKKNNARLIHFFDNQAFSTVFKAAQKSMVRVKLASAQSDWLGKPITSRLKQLDALICSTEEIKKQFLKNNVPVPRMEVIPPGLDFSQYKENQKKDFLRKEFGLASDDFLVGLLTPLEDLKIFKGQLEALRMLQDQAPKLKFIVFGQGNLHLEHLRHELPVELSNLYFYLGFEEKRPEIFSSLDLFIFGAFSLPEKFLLEAMTRKVPVIGVMAAGMTELIIHRETGYLVPPNDPPALSQAVLKIYLDRSFALHLSQQAFDLVLNKYSCEAMAQKMVNYYEFLALQKGVQLGRESHHS